jgi:hypothetical protein
MIKPKHSPAPWSYDIEHGATTFLVFNKDNFIIARHVNSTSDEEGKRTVEEAEANAKLICASPELLSLAKRILAEYKDHSVAVKTPIAYFKAFAELEELVEKIS